MSDQEGRPTWGSAGERPGAPRAEDQLAEQGVTPPRRPMTPHGIATWVDQSIQQATRQGAFDNLPGAGKPLPDIDTHADPDWWVKGLIEREKLDLSDAMPGTMQLRREKATYPDALIEIDDEASVRERLEDFNERVLADRRRPHAGPHSPPIVGRIDVEEYVAAWHELRAHRAAAVAAALADDSAETTTTEDADPEDGAEADSRRWFRWRLRGSQED